MSTGRRLDGADPGGSWEVLAFFILERECSEIAYEMEEEREQQEAAQ